MVRPSVDLTFFVLSLGLYVVFAESFPVPPVFSLINYMIAVSALAWIFVLDRSATSLRKIFFLCCMIFYAISPRLEMSRSVAYYSGSLSVFTMYDVAAILALGAMWCFALAFALGQRVRIRWSSHEVPAEARPILLSGPRLILLSAGVVALIYHVNDYSFINVLFRDSSEGDVLRLSGPLQLVYDNSLRAMPSICFIIYMLFGARRALVALILLALMLIGNPITGFARWQGAMLYLAAALACFPALIRTPYLVTLGLFASVFLIFPLLDAFRFFREDLTLQFSLDWMRQGHLDSFQNFARVLEQELVTFGVQIVGVLLFFVPRELWPGKPVASSVDMARAANLGHENVGLNIIGEGYVNFGILGVFLFAAVLGLICSQLDRAYWRDRNYSRPFQAFYLFFLGGLVFVFRGALLSAFSYMVGTFIAIVAVLWIGNRYGLRLRLRR